MDRPPSIQVVQWKPISKQIVVDISTLKKHTFSAHSAVVQGQQEEEEQFFIVLHHSKPVRTDS